MNLYEKKSIRIKLLKGGETILDSFSLFDQFSWGKFRSIFDLSIDGKTLFNINKNQHSISLERYPLLNKSNFSIAGDYSDCTFRCSHGDIFNLYNFITKELSLELEEALNKVALGEKNIKIEFDLILTCKKFEEEQEKNKPKPLSDLIGIPGPSGVTFGPKR